jgi:hypothetical protein
MTTGHRPAIALFDRAKAFLDSRKVRGFLEDRDCDSRYSKGFDPRFILGLERILAEFHVFERTLDDPLTWPDHYEDFILLVNSDISERTGMSRGGLAHGHGPAHARALELRHSTLMRSLNDSKELPPPRLRDGTEVRVIANPKSKQDLSYFPAHLVEYGRATSLIENPKGEYHWVPTRRIREVAQIPQQDPIPNSLPLGPGATVPLSDLPKPVVAAPIPLTGMWVAYSDGGKPHVGVCTSEEKVTIHVHAFQYSSKKEYRRHTAVWLDSRTNDRLGDKGLATWTPAVYLIDKRAILASAPREDLFSLPLPIKKAMATYARDPRARQVPT